MTSAGPRSGWCVLARLPGTLRFVFSQLCGDLNSTTDTVEHKLLRQLTGMRDAFAELHGSTAGWTYS